MDKVFFLFFFVCNMLHLWCTPLWLNSLAHFLKFTTLYVDVFILLFGLYTRTFISMMIFLVFKGDN